MNYKTYQPCDELSAFVKCYWSLEIAKADIPEKQRIVPDGCMEMIFHYGDPYMQYLDDKNSIIQPRCFVFGQITSDLDIEPTGKTGIFAVRFHPEGFMPFATMPVKEMENRAVSLEILFGRDGLSLEREILDVQSTAKRIKIAEKFLSGKLINPRYVDSVVETTVETILSIDGRFSIGKFTQQMNINRRQLERKFSSAIGLSPKQLSRIIRLQKTLKILLNEEFTNLTELAYEGNYYDQAHFIKDFKEFTGVTPKEFYANKLKMSSLFYGME